MVDRVEPADRCLAVYGSLAPGQPNHHVLEGIEGEWRHGFVLGHLEDRGWAAGLGFPALRHDPGGDRVPVDVLCSEQLPDHWARLDAFEGPGYVRIVVPVYSKTGVIAHANLYAAREHS